MFGERLKEIRKANGHAQNQLAALLKVNKATVSSWERGRYMPSKEKLDELCLLYQVTPEYLLGLADFSPSSDTETGEEISESDQLRRAKNPNVTQRIPDRAAIAAAIESNRHQVAGILLVLAWHQGLSRNDLCALTWSQIDFDKNTISLSNRTITLTPEARTILMDWYLLYGECSDHVVISEKYKRPMAKESISLIVRKALDSEGLTDVRLDDLRQDYNRIQLEEHDWRQALQITGLSLSTYRNKPAGREKANYRHVFKDKISDDTKEQILTIIEKEKTTPAGIALALVYYLGLSSSDIVGLTWERVSFSESVLIASEQRYRVPEDLLVILQEELSGRCSEDDPHIIITPKTGKPIDVNRLSTIMRNILIRGGVTELTPEMVQMSRSAEEDKRRILDYVREYGSINRSECIKLLSGSQTKAHSRLNELATEGVLIRNQNNYYSCETTIEPENRKAAILKYISENGTADRKAVMQLLHIGRPSASLLLKELVDEGKLDVLLRPKRYLIPK